jgi:hypothetical protein
MDPADSCVDDTSHQASAQVNAAGNHQAEDKAGPFRRQQCLGGLRRDRPQPATCHRNPGRYPSPHRPREHATPPPGQRPGPAGPTPTPTDPAPTPAMALATSMDDPVAQHHRPPIQRLNHHPPSRQPGPNRKSWTDQRHHHACRQPTSRSTAQPATTGSIGGIRFSVDAPEPILDNATLSGVSYTKILPVTEWKKARA